MTVVHQPTTTRAWGCAASARRSADAVAPGAAWPDAGGVVAALMR